MAFLLGVMLPHVHALACSPCPASPELHSGSYLILRTEDGQAAEDWLLGAELRIDRDAGTATIRYDRDGGTYEVTYDVFH